MPYKCKSMKIPEEKDRRVKLTAEQRLEIYEKYKTGNYSQRELAKQYSVSRRLIQFIADPEKKARNLECRKERGGSKQYYDKDKHREAMKKHRTNKQKLYLNGDLE